MLHGDIYFMRDRVREEYPSHDIVYAGDGRYQVIEMRRQLRYEGDLNGRPLFLMVDVSDPVFEFSHVPDMRVLRKLREMDLWRHPRGPQGILEDMARKSEQTRQKRDEKRRDGYEQAAKDRWRRVVAEMDGMSKSVF